MTYPWNTLLKDVKEEIQIYYITYSEIDYNKGKDASVKLSIQNCKKGKQKLQTFKLLFEN
jgi:hypothetical protein